jgi:hypothetical protein
MRGPENYGGDVNRFFTEEINNAGTSGELLAYRGIPGAAKLEYFRGQDIRTGVIGLFGCTSIIVISRGAVWVSHWWEKPVFFLTSFEEFRNLLLIPMVEGNGDRMPGLSKLADPTQPFEAKYQPRAIIASVKLRDGRYIFEYDNKINYIQDKLKAIIPGIRITIYKYARNKKDALQVSSPIGKILIQYSATEPNCERKYRVWIEAQDILEESWPAAEGLPNISSGDVNTCRSSSTIISSDYSTSRRSSTITSSDYSTSRRSSTITSSDYSTSRRSSTITSSGYSTSTSTSSSPLVVETSTSSFLLVVETFTSSSLLVEETPTSSSLLEVETILYAPSTTS